VVLHVRDAGMRSGLPSNLLWGFQRFGFEKLFRAEGFSDLGQGLVLRMVKSSSETPLWSNSRFDGPMDQWDVQVTTCRRVSGVCSL